MNILVRTILRADNERCHVYKEAAIIDYDKGMASPENKIEEDIKKFTADHADMDTVRRIDEKGAKAYHPIISPKHRAIVTFTDNEDKRVSYSIHYFIYDLADLVRTQTPIMVERYGGEEEL